jgi:cell pole-organizing protein PopZ
MSKPDAAGGNLESILASIRRSLSEQSTDALTEDAPAAAAPVPPPPVEDRNGAKSARREGLAQRLAGATGPPSPDAAARADDLAGLVEEAPARPGSATTSASASASPSAAVAASPAAELVSPALAASPAAAPVAPSTSATASVAPSAAAPAAGERSEGDPLWFLTPGPEPEASKAAEQPSGASEPTLRPEVLRATLPPFFGSSAEAAKAEAAPAAAPPSPPAPVAVTRPPAARPDAARRGGEAEPPKAKPAARPAPADSFPAAAPAAAAEAPAAAASPLRNGRANSHSEPAAEAQAAPKAAAFGDTPNAHALEAVVVDMLRPMLREWLDDNMPRLVASALADEAAARARTRDPRKS